MFRISRFLFTVFLVLLYACPVTACGRSHGERHGLFSRIREARQRHLHELLDEKPADSEQKKTEHQSGKESAPAAPTDTVCKNGRCSRR